MPKKKRAKKTTLRKSAKKTTPKIKLVRKRAASKQSLARKMKFSAKRKRVTSTGLVMETAPLSSVERREKELLEEGNALEPEAKQGVENALDADQAEGRTREEPEDDVPQEYLDKGR